LIAFAEAVVRSVLASAASVAVKYTHLL
jgi:hypothetical protein